MAILRSSSTALAALLVASVATAQAPANDDCANAISIGTGLTAVDNSLATTDGLTLDPLVCDLGASGDEQIHSDVWFEFTPGTTDNYRISTLGLAGFDTRLAVYDQVGCPDDPNNVIACNDDEIQPIVPPFEAGLVTNLTGGTSYLIRLGNFSAATAGGAMNMDVAVFVPPVPPANDDCANAELLPDGFQTFTWDNTNATTDGADATGFCDYGASGTEINENDVWYLWTPTQSGCHYISHLGLAAVDTRLTIYDDTSCPDDPANIIACVDDEVLPIAAPFEAGLDIDVTAGTQYLIRCGTFSPATPQGSYQCVIGMGPQAENNNTSGSPQLGAPGCPPAPVFASFCNGDGGNGAGCTDCPCGNNAPAGTEGGCLNSAASSGQLVASGSASVSAPDPTDLRFDANGLVPASFAVLTSGAALAPQNAANPCFGLNSGVQSAVLDGLRCAVQSTQRHGGRPVAADGTVGSSTNGWGGASGPPAGLAAQGGFIAGDTRYYQVFYRELPGQVCLTEQNTSQAVEVTFTP